MPKNILIASLGKSPIVITAIVKALKEIKQINLDEVVVLYPEKAENIKDAFDIIESQLKKVYSLPVTAWRFPFADVSTSGDCYHFLQEIYTILERNIDDIIYLSLAGGRKSMSALMGVLVPFYRNIKGVYHILDKFEDDPERKNFHSIETLTGHYIDNEDLLQQKMFPLLESLNLIELPFEYYANADELRKILSRPDYSEEYLNSVNINFEEESFYASIFQQQKPPEQTEVKLSLVAKEQMKNPQIKDNKERTGALIKCFKLLMYNTFRERAGKDKGGKHASFPGKDTYFYAAKRPHTAERPIWAIKDGQVVICELGIENDAGKYIKVGTSTILNEKYFAEKSINDYLPLYSLSEINPEEVVLIAGVGKSPMVISQAYRLLKEKSGLKIKVVILIYPQENGLIKSGVSYLEEVFGKEKIKTEKFGLAGYTDIDSKKAGEAFLQKTVEVINDAKKQHPEKTLSMLLAGGRKGMAMLTLLAAQHSNIRFVYHTLIKNEKLAEELEKKGAIKTLCQLKKSERINSLLLKDFTLDNFELFSLPVIPFN